MGFYFVDFSLGWARPDRLEQKNDYFQIVKFCYFPSRCGKSEPAKKHFILSLFTGHTHLNLKFTTNTNIFQNKKTYVKP